MAITSVLKQPARANNLPDVTSKYPGTAALYYRVLPKAKGVFDAFASRVAKPD